MEENVTEVFETTASHDKVVYFLAGLCVGVVGVTAGAYALGMKALKRNEIKLSVVDQDTIQKGHPSHN